MSTQNKILHKTSKPASANTPQQSEIVAYIQTLLSSPATSADDLIPEQFKDIEGLPELKTFIFNMRAFVASLAAGNLHFQTGERGYLSGILKALQANLLHLTWQLHCIGKGEFNHRASFLGDFSDAFNNMAEQLDSQVTNLTALSEEYKNLSARDALTGLFNRYGFFQAIEKKMHESHDPMRRAVLIIADLDKFKNINDTYGHICGDEVLQAFAHKLLTSLRTSNICCRYGGEEFLVFIPEATLQEGCLVAERLRELTTKINIRLYPDIRLTASFGLSEVSLENPTGSIVEFLKPAIQLADAKLYQAKEAGRNCIMS